MKKSLFYIGLVALCLFTSCAVPKQSVVNISGVPGTHIYESPIREKPLGVIPQSGTLALTLNNEVGMWDVLFAHDSIRNIMVPFALNYTNHNYHREEMRGTGIALFSVGSAALLGGMLTMIAGGVDEQKAWERYNSKGSYVYKNKSALERGKAAAKEIVVAGSIPFSIGAGLAGAGGALWGVADLKGNALFNNNFNYLPNQVTNQDLALKMPEYEYEPRVSPLKPKVQEVQDDLAKAEISTIKLRDNTKTIVGTYKGTCTISQDGEEIDQIANIQLQLARVNNTTVSGVLLDAQGNELLGKAAEFQVRKKDGNFVLTNKEKEDVTINIDSNGKLIYNNPSVLIEDAIYQIQVQANKK